MISMVNVTNVIGDVKNVKILLVIVTHVEVTEPLKLVLVHMVISKPMNKIVQFVTLDVLIVL
jgi:hypothetical protein